MPNFKPGDILEWDRQHPEFHEVEKTGFANDGPFVMISRPGEYTVSIKVKRLNGEPFSANRGYEDSRFELPWFAFRFRKHVFLDAAKKAIADA